MEEKKNNFVSQEIRGETEKSMKELHILYLNRGLSYTAYVKIQQRYI